MSNLADLFNKANESLKELDKTFTGYLSLEPNVDEPPEDEFYNDCFFIDVVITREGGETESVFASDNVKGIVEFLNAIINNPYVIFDR